jgi:hypothetical protein
MKLAIELGEYQLSKLIPQLMELLISKILPLLLQAGWIPSVATLTTGVLEQTSTGVARQIGTIYLSWPLTGLAVSRRNRNCPWLIDFQ